MCALQKDETKSNENNVSVIVSKKQSRNFTCYFCEESKWHPRSRCPAKNEICDFCGKVGHYAKCCLKRKNSLNCVDQHCLAPTTTMRSTFSQHVLAEITVNNISGQALVDTGSTNSYRSKLRIRPRCLKFFFLILNSLVFNSLLSLSLSLSLVHSLSRSFYLFLLPLSVALYKQRNCRAGRTLYKMKITAVERIIY